MSPGKKRRPQGTGGLEQRCGPQYGCPPVVETNDGDGKVRKVRPPHKCRAIYVGRVDFGWKPNGTRDRRTVSSMQKAEAQRKLRDLIRQRDAGETGRGARLTVKAWADQWLPMHAAKVRPTTYTTDAGAVTKWIVPTLGHRRLGDLTPADLRNLRTTILNAGRSSTTALHAHKLLVKMLKDAIVEGHRVPERVLLTPKPSKAANDRTSIPVDQALAILDVVRARDDAPRWVASLLQGMRQGEALGLTWDAVDLDRNLVDVSWQLQHIKPGGQRPDKWEERHLTGRAHLTRPKTAAGRRLIPMVPWMRAALAEARGLWVPNPWNLIWTDGGRPISKERDRAEWHAIQAEANVSHPSGRPWHGHEMRHTTATLLLEAGVDRAVIEAILGQAVLVESYLHVGQDQARAALEQVAHKLALEG